MELRLADMSASPYLMAAAVGTAAHGTKSRHGWVGAPPPRRRHPVDGFPASRDSAARGGCPTPRRRKAQQAGGRSLASDHRFVWDLVCRHAGAAGLDGVKRGLAAAPPADLNMYDAHDP